LIFPQNQIAVQAELNLFAVQMLAQPLDFAIYTYLSGAIASLYREYARNFKQNFAQIECNRIRHHG